MVDVSVIELLDLHLHYERPDGSLVHIARGLELRVAGADSVCLAGRSGSGKTSILLAALGIVAPAAGHVLWEGRPVDGMRAADVERWRTRRVGYLDQEASVLPGLTVAENIAVAGLAPGATFDPARAEELLEQLSLTQVAGARAATLSGGERQRVALARTLALPHEVLVLDEPTASLDAGLAGSVLEVLTAERAAGAAVLVASHDPLVREWAHRVVDVGG